MNTFKIVSDFVPTGDQPQAVKRLVEGFRKGTKFQTLMGVTGSGKTFTMAHIIQELQKPTIVMAHNKTLAAQLYSEFKEFFPNNSVEYFVSYYDYYQPEAYVPSSDTYIEKDSSINEEIDRLRHSATSALFERRDVIIVASVSCIYGLGDPKDYWEMSLSLRPGMVLDRDDMLRKLVEIQFVRNDINFTRGTFRVRGDVVEIFPAWSMDIAFRVEFFGDEIERIQEVDSLTGEVLFLRNHLLVYPVSHFVTNREKMEVAIRRIDEELHERLMTLRADGRLLEAQRLEQRTSYDIEMMREMGFCSGIENYSRHLAGREAGSTPYTLFDFFPDDMLIIADESHQTIPQVRGMFEGDKSRKTTLVEHGFRLPSALDNRPLRFDEFEGKIKQLLFVSATPGPYEHRHSEYTAEQVIRPTGLLDPEVIVRPVMGQIDDLTKEVHTVTRKGHKVLVTTLTKKMAEDLTAYLKDNGVLVRYLHSDIETLERLEIIRDLRMGVFDVLVGINLLREGLDLPEVSLVAILDADKEGFLRSETSLIQTIGRAARHVEGRVIMYADKLTDSMRKAISETNRRRGIQMDYNEQNGITPKSIEKKVHGLIQVSVDTSEADKDGFKGKKRGGLDKDPESMNRDELIAAIKELEKEMRKAAQELQFERAALIRDRVLEMKKFLNK
ncbi:MAG: excinuclease ABC subunit UvrB [Defluviitaleaceae bacterium]|nr:excinuclease ABC subunit UvrB [Defluviitaleaceae bacterium]MCL2835898.1 excinuclease ABC subunit UvrB [Defluviitaleaceae bacterium]